MGFSDTSNLAEKFNWPYIHTSEIVQIIHVGGCHWECLLNKLVEGETHVMELFHHVVFPPTWYSFQVVLLLLLLEVYITHYSRC